MVLQNLVAFWGEIINAIQVSRTPPSSRKFGRKKVWEKVSGSVARHRGVYESAAVFISLQGEKARLESTR